MVRRAFLQAAVLALSCVLLARCSVYDDQLAHQDRGRGSLAATRTDAGVLDAGRAGLIIEAGSAPQTSPESPVPGGPAPPTRTDAHEEDAGPRAPHCGDGEVNGAERCDTGIPQGQPGACPRSCPALTPCAPRVLNGTGCQAQCVLRELSCESGDDCCPAKCTKDNDLDCSAKCGDGIVQESSGETCEAGTDTPCLTSAEACDDHEACTQDTLQGSAANCNARCVHMKTSELKSGDGCCPDGANAGSDSDCTPMCGNDVMEPGEQCDGGPGCEPDCKLVSDTDLQRCLMGARNDCERCSCMNCTGTEVSCRLNASEDESTLCNGVISCMQTNECVGNPLASCYCGVTLICGLPYGACRAQVEAAGKTGDLDALNNAMNDRNTPLGRAAAADLCRITRCLNECR